MQASELARRLKVEPGSLCLVVNPPAGYLDRMSPLPDGASFAELTSSNVDFVQVFAQSRDELEREFDGAFKALKPHGLLWVAYPNSAGGQSDLSRNHGWHVLHGAGLTATDEAAIDERWDAIRFQPSADVPGSAIPAADMLPVGRKASAAFRAVRVVARGLFRLMFRFDFGGRERIPDQAYVLIANHLGWMDAISLLLLFPAEPRIHYLADPTSMMRNKPLWTLVRATGGIVPVDRSQRSNATLFRHVQRCLEQGGVVAMFPEGDFGPREGEVLPFKKGFAHFAIDASVPVLPVGLAGMKEVWLGKRLFINVAEPIVSSGKTVDEVVAAGEAAVAAAVPRYVEPQGPKPLRRWLTGLF